MKNGIIYNFILLTFFLSSNLTAQIPLNGFCRYNQVNIRPNFTKISAVDFNSDGYRDLIIYNQQSNQYLTLTADAKLNFGYASNRSSSISLTALHSIGNEMSGKKYLALSRKTREISEITFSRGGGFFVNSKYKLDGFGSSIDVGDINADGKTEAVVAGTSQDGMKILKSNKGRIVELENIKGKIFSSAIFIDLNYDSFLDIAAYDVVSNSIVFYVNDGIGDFEESRSINVGSDINEFRAVDVNSDGFTDLTFIQDHKLQIMYGDSVSTFQKKNVLSTGISIDNYSIMDFNRDGYNDIACLSKESGEVNIFYAKGMNQYHQPVLYIKKNNLCDMDSYVDRGGSKLVVLSSDGAVYMISSVSFQEGQFSISLGENPISAKTFDAGNDLYKDIAFLDKAAGLLKLVLSERRNLFRTLFDVPLSTHPNNFLVDDNDKNMKTFFCYSIGERTIEAIRYDFANHTYKKNVVYSEAPIREIKLVRDRLKDRITLYALVNENEKLFLQTIEIKDFNLTNSAVAGVALKAAESTINLSVYRDVYYVLAEENKLNLIKSIVDEKVIKNDSKISFVRKPNDTYSVSFAAIPELFNRYKPVAAVLSLKKNSSLYFFLEKESIKIPLRKYISATLTSQYFIENDNNISVFCYNDSDGKLYQLNAMIKERNVKESILLEMKGINDYFVSRLDERSRYLICTNKIQNSITFKKL